MKVLVNGKFRNRQDVVVDLEDRGYQFADGVYEVIRVYEGVPFALEEHVQRLFRSANEIGISLPYDTETLKQMLISVVKENQTVDGGIYVQVTRGIAPRKHRFDPKIKPHLIAYPLPSKRLVKEQKEGVACITADDLRWLRCDIKSLNLLYNVMMKQKAYESGAFEALLIRNGYVTEGTSSNVFIVKNGTIITHPANHLILHGVTRMILIRLFNEQKWSYVEKAFSREELLAADEVFITSSTSEVMPVVTVDGYRIADGLPGPFTRKLQALYLQTVQQNIRDKQNV